MKKVLSITIFTTLLILTLGIFYYSGCQQNQDGSWRLNPFAAEQIEDAAETATGALGLLSLFVPGLAGVAGIAAGITGAYKKMKPGLTKYKNTSKHIVASVERIKKNQPELWAKIKTEFKEGTNADVEQVINQLIANDWYSCRTAKEQEKQING